MTKHADAWRVVRDLGPNVAIAHHIAGRIRLKLKSGASSLGGAARPPVDDIRAAIESLPGVHQVRINLLARSCTVEYDARVIPPTAWSDLLNGTESPAADALVGALRAKYDDWRR